MPKTRIEFYIPIEKLRDFLRGGIVLYTTIAANGLIKLTTSPNYIIFVRKDGNLYYIRRAKFKERLNLKRKGKVK